MNKNMILCQLFKKYFLLKGKKKAYFIPNDLKKKKKKTKGWKNILL